MTSQESTASEVLDILVVGGGPGGTAAAFRARELGLSVLVVDYDDLMKRIRDYSKDKLILPSFGGGDKMRFPKGGPLVSCLSFQPIDKDDMCDEWKGFYRQHQVPHRLGVELTGLERRGGARRDRRLGSPGLGPRGARRRRLPHPFRGPGARPRRTAALRHPGLDRRHRLPSHRP